MKRHLSRPLSLLGFETGRGHPLSPAADTSLGQLTIVLLLRLVILLGVATRFAVHRAEYAAQTGLLEQVVSAVLAFAGYLAILAVLRHQARSAFLSETSQLTQIVLDTCFVSYLYYLAGKVESDFFLFYVTPLLLISPRNWRLKSALSILLPAIAMLLLMGLIPAHFPAGGPPDLFANLLRVYAPRMVLLGAVWGLMNALVLYRIEVEREFRDKEDLRELLGEARQRVKTEAARADQERRAAASAVAAAATAVIEANQAAASATTVAPEPTPATEPELEAATAQVDSTSSSEHYEILKPLSRGFGDAFLANDRLHDEVVGLRFLAREQLPGQELAELRGFVSRVQSIAHPNVVRVLDLVVDPDATFVAFEHLSGVPLRSLLDRQHAFPLGPGMQIAKELCSGLAAIHQVGIHHGDLNPHNVLLLPSGVVKVGVFGAAQVAKSGTAGVAAPSPDYQSPEQLDGLEVDQRTDIYALGLILYELFTGVHPFRGEDAAEVARRQREEQPPLPSAQRAGIPKVLQRLVMSCLHKQPEKRPDNARTARATFDRLDSTSS